MTTPEYTFEELKNIGLIYDDENDGDPSNDDYEDSLTSNDNLNSSRLENLHWCSCSNCCIMRTLVDWKCCKECETIREKLGGVSCITDSEEFETLCINKCVLKTAFFQYGRYLKNFKSLKEMNNK